MVCKVSSKVVFQFRWRFCRWDDQFNTVFDVVAIVPPYLESCKEVRCW